MQTTTRRLVGALGPPPTLLARVRWFFLAFVLFFAATFVPQLVLGSTWPVPVRLASSALLLALGAWWARCYARQHFPLAALPLELAVFAAVTLTPSDPFKSLGLLYIAVNFRALYGSLRQVGLFTFLTIATFVGAVLWAPHLGLMDRATLLPFTLPGVPVLAVIAHLVSVASLKADQAVARERGLRAAGLAIVQADGAAAVRSEVLAAARRLLAGVPGATVELREAQPEPPVAAAHEDVVALPSRHGDMGSLVITSRSAVPAEVREAMQVLAAQASLGLQSAALTSDLTHRASHDPLTDLANRAAVSAHLDGVLRAHSRQPDGRGRRSWAVMLLDLDGFKAINDDHGHAAGDRVLEATAHRLRAAMRDGDLVGRLGGDEFVVVLSGLAGEAELDALTGRLETRLGEPVRVAGSVVAVGVSIGSAFVGPEDRVSAEELLARADAAMYRVKQARRREGSQVAARSR